MTFNESNKWLFKWNIIKYKVERFPLIKVTNLFIQNTTVFYLELALLFNCILLFANSTVKVGYRNISYFLMFLIFLFLVFNLSRVGMICCAVSTVYVLRPGLIYKANGRFKFLYLLIILALIFIIYVVKFDSSQGRLHILKISLKLWQEHFVTGVGFGNFNPAFNHSQLDYFSNKSLFSQEAILANDGYFAFNEWIQLSVELGIYGFLLSILLLFFFVKEILVTRVRAEGALLITILIQSFISYPFHNILILLFTFYIIMRIFFIRYLKGDEKRILKLIRFLLVTLYLIILGEYLNKEYVISKTKYNFENGNIQKSVAILNENSNRYLGDYKFDIFYLTTCYKIRDLEKAVFIFKKIHKHHCNQAMHAIIAKCHEELGNFDIAEKEYLVSLYLTPHLLQSRLELMNFYRRWKKDFQAFFWANEILRYPPKKSSITSKLIKENAFNYIESTKEKK